eukprot:TRINITY_DN17271_c0_g4_i1.p1 TRINITY_DN17271_c0_g4~~TRINITY_DN17271_c0_g4_i1.p1  ORF type:complete len:424 (-),score=57.23 TRINITY_DN17271_c0_g4_i1:139-1410(-)
MEELRRKVLAVDLRYPKGLLSPEAIHLFHCLLQRDPRSRVSASRLLAEHPWVRSGLSSGSGAVGSSPPSGGASPPGGVSPPGGGCCSPRDQAVGGAASPLPGGANAYDGSRPLGAPGAGCAGGIGQNESNGAPGPGGAVGSKVLHAGLVGAEAPVSRGVLAASGANGMRLGYPGTLSAVRDPSTPRTASLQSPTTASAMGAAPQPAARPVGQPVQPRPTAHAATPSAQPQPALRARLPTTAAAGPPQDVSAETMPTAAAAPASAEPTSLQPPQPQQQASAEARAVAAPVVAPLIRPSAALGRRSVTALSAALPASNASYPAGAPTSPLAPLAVPVPSAPDASPSAPSATVAQQPSLSQLGGGVATKGDPSNPDATSLASGSGTSDLDRFAATSAGGSRGRLPYGGLTMHSRSLGEPSYEASSA